MLLFILPLVLQCSFEASGILEAELSVFQKHLRLIAFADLYIVAFQHCFITGGSSGLGLSLAVLLVQRGANVSIVARNEGRLKKALERLEVRRRVR